MATISIARKHSLSHRQARDAAEKIAKDLKKRFDLDYAWDGEHIDFERPGLTGRMQVGKDRIKLEVQLGLLLGMLKPTIEREINVQLDKLLGNLGPRTSGRETAADRETDPSRRR